MAQFVRLRIQKGDDFSRQFVCKDAAGVVNDLTGCALKMQIRDANTSAVLLELSTENGKIDLTPAPGLFVIKFAAADTATATWESAIYDCQLTDSANEITTLFGGDVLLLREVTK
jgi:hypothetical protein